MDKAQKELIKTYYRKRDMAQNTDNTFYYRDYEKRNLNTAIKLNF